MTAPTDASIDSAEEELVELTSDLIRFRTHEHGDQAFSDARDYITSQLKDIGVEFQLLEGVRGDTILGHLGPVGEKQFILMGHYDVVHTGPVGWSFDPFEPQIKGDRLYGRGAASMKAGIASMLVAARSLKAVEDQLEGRCWFLFTHDELIDGEEGAERVVAENLIPKEIETIGIMPECSGSENIWIACLGSIWVEVQVLGREAHVSAPAQGLNAFEGAVLLAQDLMHLKKKIASRTTALQSELEESPSAKLNLGGISSSGSSFMVIPGQTTFTVDRRLLPEEDTAQAMWELNGLVSQFEANYPDYQVSILEKRRSEPMLISYSHPVIPQLQSEIERVWEARANLYISGSSLEASVFTNNGQPVVGYGPGRLEHAMSQDEWVRISDLVPVTKVLAGSAFAYLS